MSTDPDFTQITGRTDVSTKEKVVLLRNLDPDFKASDMARVLMVSRERIRQILVKEDLERNVRRRLYLESIVESKCTICGKQLNSSDRLYCSRPCYWSDRKAETWTFECPNCGTVKTIRESLRRVFKGRKHKNIFCIKSCFQAFRKGRTHKQLAKLANLWRDSL